MKSKIMKLLAIITVVSVVFGGTATYANAKGKTFTNIKNQKKITLDAGGKKTVKTSVNIKSVKSGNKDVAKVKKVSKRSFQISAIKSGKSTLTIKCKSGAKKLQVTVKAKKKKVNKLKKEVEKAKSMEVPAPEKTEDNYIPDKLGNVTVKYTSYEGSVYDMYTNTMYYSIDLFDGSSYQDEESYISSLVMDAYYCICDAPIDDIVDRVDEIIKNMNTVPGVKATKYKNGFRIRYPEYKMDYQWWYEERNEISLGA